MLPKLRKIRKIATDIQTNKATFSTLYSYLDSLEQCQRQQQQHSSSQDEIDMQKYIMPVRTMLGEYKKSISNIRDNQRMMTKSTDVSNQENVCPNVGRAVEGHTRRKQKNYKEVSLKQLDDEIEQLSKKLNLH